MFGRSASIQFRKSVIGAVQRRNGSSVDVIVLRKIENKAEPGQLIRVKRGYARNYLFPNKLAGLMNDAQNCFGEGLILTLIVAYATLDNKEKFKPLIEEAAAAAAAAAKLAQAVDATATEGRVIEETVELNPLLVDFAESAKLSLSMKTASGSNTLYASVSAAQILEELQKHDVGEIKEVVIAEPIKTLGDHQVVVDGVELTVTIKSSNE